MSWLEVSVSTEREHVALVEEALEMLGALAVTLEDDADNPVLEPAPGATPLWPVVHVRGLYETDVDREHVIAGLQTVPGANRPGNIRWREFDDQAWERAWMDRFHPMKFGKLLWIVPSGMSIPHDPQNIEISLDPGLAFGTGTHPTTALCLEWLDGLDVSEKRVVDFGCGSGILGIAAALKGAAKVVCVDNDPQALLATAENADRNGVRHKIVCLMPEKYVATPADIVMANILATPLVKLAPVIIASLVRRGSLALSGLLQEQHEEVAAAYRHTCSETGSKSLDGWLRLDFTKS